MKRVSRSSKLISTKGEQMESQARKRHIVGSDISLRGKGGRIDPRSLSIALSVGDSMTKKLQMVLLTIALWALVLFFVGLLLNNQANAKGCGKPEPTCPNCPNCVPPDCQCRDCPECEPPDCEKPKPLENWEKIVKESKQKTTDRAPLGSKIIGDVWSEWLESPLSIKKMNRFTNLTEIMIQTEFFNPLFDENKSWEYCLKNTKGFTGAKDVTVWEKFKIAQAIGQNVQITIDSSCSVNGYHKCDDKIHSHAQAPLSATNHMANYRRIYDGFLGYMNRKFNGLVTHVQIENEPCYRAFNDGQYVTAVKNVTPIIRNKMPKAKIIVGDASRVFGINSGMSTAMTTIEPMSHGGECGNEAANQKLDFDILGFHVALPRTYWSNQELKNYVKTQASELKSTYPKYDIWCDECGIGAMPWQASNEDGKNRLIGMLEGCFEGGCKGFMYLIIGSHNSPKIGNFGSLKLSMALFNEEGETISAAAVRNKAKECGVYWGKN